MEREKVNKLARVIYAAITARTPGEYRQIKTEDMFGIEELLFEDLLEIFGAVDRSVTKLRQYDDALERNPIYKRVTTRAELSAVEGADEDEAKWNAALEKHEKDQLEARTAWLNEF